MTKSLDGFWLSNDDWWHAENGKPVINDDAPEEAQKSYAHYLQQLKEKKKYI